MSKPSITESTIARIAGNIAAGIVGNYSLKVLGDEHDDAVDDIATAAVSLARAIVTEVQRTEPKEPK